VFTVLTYFKISYYLLQALMQLQHDTTASVGNASAITKEKDTLSTADIEVYNNKTLAHLIHTIQKWRFKLLFTSRAVRTIICVRLMLRSDLDQATVYLRHLLTVGFFYFQLVLCHHRENVIVLSRDGSIYHKYRDISAISLLSVFRYRSYRSIVSVTNQISVVFSIVLHIFTARSLA